MITLWHNPRCSKSREALKIIEKSGAEITVRRYLDEPPSRDEIASVLAKLGLEPIAAMRTGEKLFRELGLSKSDAPERLLEAMAANPILIERPIAIREDRAVIGRPPEAVRDLI